MTYMDCDAIAALVAAKERISKLESIATSVTAGLWSQLSDENKLTTFALLVDETARRKAAEAEVERLRPLLTEALAVVQMDRISLAETSTNQHTGQVDDPADREAIARLDDLLRRADEALGCVADR